MFSFLIIVAVCVADDSPQSVGGEEGTLKYMNLVSRIFENNDGTIPDDYLLINIGYDRMLTDISDEMGVPAGNIDITDRFKLNRLLEVLADDPGYKGIILDIAFDDALETESDSALFTRINSMPRILVSQEGSRIDSAKMAMSSYAVSMLESNMVKFPFVHKGEESLVTKYKRMYSGGTKDSWRNMDCMILPLDIHPSGSYDDSGEKYFYNLGTDLLDVYDENDIRELARDKTIIIGDFTVSDFHDTYQGSMAGPYILLNALEVLRHEKNRVGYWSLALSFVVYMLICLWLGFGGFRLNLPSFWRFCLSGVNYSLILVILSAMQWWLFGQFHDQLFPGILITCFYFICTYRLRIISFSCQNRCEFNLKKY